MKTILCEFLLVMFLAVFGGFVVSCSSDSDDAYTVEFDEEAFNAARAGWESLNIDSYEFNQYIDCWSEMMFQGIHCVVVDGELTGYTVIEDSNGMDVYDGLYSRETIPELFDMISSLYKGAFDEEGEPAFDVNIKIEYNSEYFYPEKIYYYMKFEPDSVEKGSSIEMHVDGFVPAQD